MSSVATIIRGVRDLSPAFDDRYTTNAVLTRALDRYQNRLWGKIRDIKPDAIRKTLQINLSTFQWNTVGGFSALTITTEVTDGTVIFTQSDRPAEPFKLVPYAQRFQPFFRWGGWLANEDVPSLESSVLYLLGVQADWEGVSSIQFHHFPVVQGPLTGLPSEIGLPVDHDDVMVAYGATVCARRARELGLEVDAERIDAEWKEAEELYIDRVTGRRRAKVGVATEVW